MLKNFQLAAISKDGHEFSLRQIPLKQSLQEQLAKAWWSHFQAFIEDALEIDFDPGYSPEEHELFCVEDYELPSWLDSESSHTATTLDTLVGDEESLDSVKGLVAFAQTSGNEEVMLFQNFNRSHVIHPGRFLLLSHDTYESVEKPALTLDGHLSAVVTPSDKKLLFRSFRTTNTFLPLSEFYREASEADIRDTLSHGHLAPEDLETTVANGNQWFRKRVAMLRDSGILDKYSVQEIKDHSNGFEVDVQIERGKIVFPSNKAAAKRLLQFLNEEIFRGAITEVLYETNSRREAD